MTPTDLKADTKAGALVVTWQDDDMCSYPFFYLRDNCVCAHCVHEVTGEKLLDPASIPKDIHIKDMKLVGNYALKIFWSDGHDAGLYTWTRLRELAAAGLAQPEPRDCP